jgi:hypothetical protein
LICGPTPMSRSTLGHRPALKGGPHGPRGDPLCSDAGSRKRAGVEIRAARITIELRDLIDSATQFPIASSCLSEAMVCVSMAQHAPLGFPPSARDLGFWWR